MIESIFLLYVLITAVVIFILSYAYNRMVTKLREINQYQDQQYLIMHEITKRILELEKKKK